MSKGGHPREWIIRLDKNVYGLKDTGLAWLENLKDSLELEGRGFPQSQVGHCAFYREYMVLLFYMDSCIMFSPYNDKVDDVYAYLQAYFKIKDDGDINNNLVIELYRRPYGTIHISQPYITQGIINLILGMYN